MRLAASRTRDAVGSHPLVISNLLIRSYFTSPNLRLKTPFLTFVACPLTSTDVCRFPSWLLYFSAVLSAASAAARVMLLPGRAATPGAVDRATGRPLG